MTVFGGFGPVLELLDGHHGVDWLTIRLTRCHLFRNFNRLVVHNNLPKSQENQPHIDRRTQAVSSANSCKDSIS